MNDIIRIMVVDDKPFFVRHVKNEIALMGECFKVVCEAYDADEALQHVRKFMPDIAMIDIEMPGVDGLTLIKMLKDLRPGLVCIVVSAYQDFALAQRAIRVKADDYLLKPVDHGSLKTVLSRYVDDILRQREQETGKEKLPPSDGQLVLRIEHYLEVNLNCRFSIEDLCQTFHLSESKLNRLFHKYRNDSVINYFNKLKICRATKLLDQNPDMPVSELASLLGFSDSLYFSKVFKRMVGCPPIKYKNNINNA